MRLPFYQHLHGGHFVKCLLSLEAKLFGSRTQGIDSRTPWNCNAHTEAVRDAIAKGANL